MQYVMPFDMIKRNLNLEATRGTVRVNVTYDDFLSIMRRLLAVASVDEAWYRATYPDVAQAVAKGVYKSAKEHFVLHGYFEGRFPYDMAVDEAWYLRAYPDVAEGVERGDLLSATHHFKSNGYREGRLPADPEADIAPGGAAATAGREQPAPPAAEATSADAITAPDRKKPASPVSETASGDAAATAGRKRSTPPAVKPASSGTEAASGRKKSKLPAAEIAPGGIATTSGRRRSAPPPREMMAERKLSARS